MYLNIVFLPLLSSFVVGFFGRFLGGRGSGIISIACVSFSFFLPRFCWGTIRPVVVGFEIVTGMVDMASCVFGVDK